MIFGRKICVSSLGWLYSILLKAVYRDARNVQRICCVTLAITRVSNVKSIQQIPKNKHIFDLT